MIGSGVLIEQAERDAPATISTNSTMAPIRHRQGPRAPPCRLGSAADGTRDALSRGPLLGHGNGQTPPSKPSAARSELPAISCEVVSWNAEAAAPRLGPRFHKLHSPRAA
jgi:hypothetical protein